MSSVPKPGSPQRAYSEEPRHPCVPTMKLHHCPNADSVDLPPNFWKLVEEDSGHRSRTRLEVSNWQRSTDKKGGHHGKCHTVGLSRVERQRYRCVGAVRYADVGHADQRAG